jgi:signal transduction histidine kinase/DNA-binding response OmpR family regulator
LGVGRGGLIGLALSDLAHPDDVGVLMTDIGSLLQDPQQVTSRDVRMRHVGGDWRALHVHGRAFALASGEQAVILSAQDATEQLKVRETLRLAKEHAEAMGRAKTDFLAVMSHEIRTPMSGIIGLIDLLKTTGLTDKQREYVGALDRAGEHLSDLLNDILDFSKIEANKIDSEKVVFDLRKVVGGIMDIFRARAEAKGVRLRARISDGLPRLWTGDVRHTRQVLANLLGNAVKFTESGFVEVRIEADGQSSDGRSLLKIAVEDTGIGIAADKLGHVFEPFAQADASPSRRHGGTGLGLAISRRLVELMEGRIWAISRLGRGSTFFVLLPMEEGATLSLSDGLFSDGRRQSDSAYFADSRVLVVDDSDLNRLVIGDMLQGLGLTVETAANGAEAVEKFDGGAYALVFLDIQMPVMDGFDAAEAMRECEEFSGRERCPIIALSATALKDDRDRALEAGCDRYLVKPMRKEALIALLKTYLPEAESIPQAIRKGTFLGVGAPMLEPELLPLLPSFFSHLEEEMAQLTRAVADQEIALVQRLAHQAKGNAMLFVFSDLVEVLRGLELVARAEKEGAALRDESTMEDWLEDVQQQASAVRAAFDDMNV